MAYQNYLTSLKLHVRKHIKDVFGPAFTDCSASTEAEINGAVQRLETGALPLPSETIDWLSNYFQYVREKDELLVYDNVSGIWHFEKDDMSLRNVLLDYFTELAVQAETMNDKVYVRYANRQVQPNRIQTLAARLRSSIGFHIRTSAEVINATEHLRYFKTLDGRRAIIDLSKPSFNLKSVSFSETQPLKLMRLHPIEISVTDEDPVLFLELLDTYMLNNPDMIAYFKKVLAYCMAPYNYNQVMLYFLGDGRNGKSTILKVLQDILGPHATRMNSELLNSKPSTSFKKDDALAATEGKSLFIFNEIDERMIVSTQNLKDITEGGRDEYGNRLMTVVRPAYSRNYEVNVCGTPLIVANTLLNFGDWSALDPIFKRLILVPFGYKIIDEDPSILDRLALEYPKIQSWLYRNYFAHKGINLKMAVRPTPIDRLFHRFRAESDIIGLFWEDCIVETGDMKDEIKRSDFFYMYQQYCQANGRIPIKNIGTNGFSNMIKPCFSRVTVTCINGTYVIKGVTKSPYFTDVVLSHAR